MSSLPYHGRMFGARQTPLSRFQLDQRLAWLAAEDKAQLDAIESLLQWRRQLLGANDEVFLELARKTIREIDNQLLHDIVVSRLEARTLIAALRRRKLGSAAPSARESWGFGRWLEVIRRHWSDSDFGLGRVYPWAADADRKLREGDSVGLERLFMGHAWDELARMGAGHYFDFEAVAVYTLRWDLINRWTRKDAEQARLRILDLVEDGLESKPERYH